MSIDLVMTYTSKPMFSTQEYTIYHEQVKHFDTMKEAKDFLKEEFYYCKTRKPVYCDKKDGSTVRAGTIYAYREKDERSNRVYNVQVWCSMHQVETKIIESTI